MRIPCLTLAVLLSHTAVHAVEFMTNSIGMKLARIEPGSFIMGQDGPSADHRMSKHPEKFDDADFDEKPAHRVTLSQPFWMAITEVTLEQYRHHEPSFRANNSQSKEATVGISWEEANEFCQWLSKREGKTYRLPTEAEWEYACRAGSTTLFHTGDSLPDNFLPWSSDLGYAERYFTDGAFPAPYRREKHTDLSVAKTPPNAWGLYDMHGNVWEWCLDWYGPYEAMDQTNPRGRVTGEFRVMRGGSHSTFARLLRSANRAAWLPQGHNNKTGFRVVQADQPQSSLLPTPQPPLHARHVQQSLPKIKATDASTPLFVGPEPFIKIQEGSVGPLYFTHNHSPSITECPNGDLLAVWYSCADEGGSELCVAASRLRLGTSTWETASPFWDGPDVNDHAPKLWWDRHKTLFFFARGRDENLMRTSTDNGVTWTSPQLIQPVGEFGNQLLQLDDGTLVLGNDQRKCSLVFSRDHGKTWDFNSLDEKAVQYHPGGLSPRYPGIHAPMAQLKDGSIMAFSRNDPIQDQQVFGFKTAVSYSSDLGKSWRCEASEFPAISSVQRAAMIRLQEEALLFCSFTDQWRDWKNRKGMVFESASGKRFTGYGLFAAVSFDEGKTWPVRRLVTPGGAPRSINGIDRVIFNMSHFYAEPCGYLAVTQSRDGNIQLISSKNHYKFNLAWLQAKPEIP